MEPTALMRSEENMRRALLKAANDLIEEEREGVAALGPETRRLQEHALMVGSHAHRSPFRES
jgi:hypothetical protein